MTSLPAASLGSVRHGRGAFHSLSPATGLPYAELLLSLCLDCAILRLVSALNFSVPRASAIIIPVLPDITSAPLPLVRLDTHIDTVVLATTAVYTD